MIKKVNGYLSKLLYGVTALTCGAFLVVVLMAVLSRYILKIPLMGSIELSRMFFIWSCFMAAALCYYQKSHIAITFVTNRLSGVVIKIVQSIIYIITLAFFILIFYHSINVVSVLWNTDLPMLGVTQSWLYIPIPVCSFFIALFTIEFLLDTLNSSPEKVKEDVVGIDH